MKGRRIVSLFRAVLVLVALAAPLAAQSPVPAGPSPAPKQTVRIDAAKLLRRMEAAVAYLAQAAKPPAAPASPAAAAAAKPTPLSPKIRDEKPFFIALGNVTTGIQTLKKELAGMTPAYFDALKDTSRAIEALKTARDMAGLDDPRVSDGVAQLGGAFEIFQGNYGKERARARAGDTLSEAEAKQLAALKEKNEKLQAAIQALRARTQGTSATDRRVATELDEVLALIEKVNAAGGAGAAGVDPKTAEMLQALAAMDQALGKYGGLKKFLEQARPELAATLTQADAAAADASAAHEATEDALPAPAPGTATESVEVDAQEVDDDVEVEDADVDRLVGVASAFATVAKDSAAHDEEAEKEYEADQKTKVIRVGEPSESAAPTVLEPTEEKAAPRMLEGQSSDE